MQRLHLLKFYWREIKIQRKRIVLTVAAIAWGTLSIVLLLAFGEGFKRQVLKARRGLGEDLVILWGGQTSIPYKGLPRGRPIRLREEDVDLLKKRIPGIERISGEYSRWGVPVTYGDKTVTRHMIGVDPDYGLIRNYIPQRGGRFFDAMDMKNKRRVAFLGTNLKQELFGDQEAVGETVIIDGVPFTVVGIMKDKLQMGMYSGPDVEKVVIPRATMKALFPRIWFANIVYRPREPERRKVVERDVYRVLSGKHRFDPQDKTALWLWDVIDSMKVMRNMMVGVQIFLGIIGGLTLFVAGVGVANIMYVAIKRRTREIGIKMAIGARPRDVLRQFLMESSLIALLGGTIGLVASAILVEILQAIPVNNEGLKWLGKPTISWQIGLITATILGAIGILAGFFPSRKAARIDPAQSLRYE